MSNSKRLMAQIADILQTANQNRVRKEYQTYTQDKGLFRGVGDPAFPAILLNGTKNLSVSQREDIIGFILYLVLKYYSSSYKRLFPSRPGPVDSKSIYNQSNVKRLAALRKQGIQVSGPANLKKLQTNFKIDISSVTKANEAKYVLPAEAAKARKVASIDPKSIFNEKNVQRLYTLRRLGKDVPPGRIHLGKVQQRFGITNAQLFPVSVMNKNLAKYLSTEEIARSKEVRFKR